MIASSCVCGGGQWRWVQPSTHRHVGGRHWARRERVKMWATQNPDDKADKNKADFSAYWALKFREFFSKRRQYLEDTEKTILKEPEVVKKLDSMIEKEKEQLEVYRLLSEEKAIADRERAAERNRDLDHQIAAELEPLARTATEKVDRFVEKLTGVDVRVHPDQQQTALAQPPPRNSEEVVERDIDTARGYMHTPYVKIVVLSLVQFREILHFTLMLPFILPKALHTKWANTFESKEYENFLMAEGERIWYWRNRTENERWFWEMFFFDRLLAPTLWTLAYLCLVPANLLWCVLVPLAFLTLQGGSFPGFFTLEVVLILFFGLYGKCGHQVAAIWNTMFVWC